MAAVPSLSSLCHHSRSSPPVPVAGSQPCFPSRKVWEGSPRTMRPKSCRTAAILSVKFLAHHQVQLTTLLSYTRRPRIWAGFHSQYRPLLSLLLNSSKQASVVRNSSPSLTKGIKRSSFFSNSSTSVSCRTDSNLSNNNSLRWELTTYS